MLKDQDLFGQEIQKDVLLRDKFIEPPFSILDTKTGTWQNRKRQWKNLGIKSEVGRADEMTFKGNMKAIDSYRVKEGKKASSVEQGTSIFDPALCEILYRWFCPAGGSIFDPFAGGSVRGIVANYLGFRYTGVDIRPEQIESNYKQAKEIIPDKVPLWIVGDSAEQTDILRKQNFTTDFVFSCPPYADLEVYSDLSGDISNMKYEDFLRAYRAIIYQSCQLLRPGCFACFVVGEVRDKKGNYYGFVPDTIKAFQDAGLHFYNEAILLNPVASASMRADKQFSAGQKLVKIHQNVLVFKKDER